MRLWAREARAGDRRYYQYVDEHHATLFEVVRYKPKAFHSAVPTETVTTSGTSRASAACSTAYRGSLRPLLPARASMSSRVRRTSKPSSTSAWSPPATPVELASGVTSTPSSSPRPTGVILPDNDDIGRGHAEEVAASLAHVGVPCVIAELPGLPEKGDVSDWFALRHTVNELTTIVGERRRADDLRRRNRMNAGAQSDDDAHRLTELGNAERFAAQHVGHVKVPRGRGLLAYDARRGIYVADHAVLVRYAKTTVRSIYGEAAET